MKSIPIAVLSALALAVSGCEAEPSVLVGDVYLADLTTEQSLGDIDVHLLPDTLAIDSLLLELCPYETLDVPADSAAQEAAWVARGEVLRRLVVRSVRANAGGSFVLDSVRAGQYRIWADTVVDGTHWSWLDPIYVTGGDTMRVNLSNANMDEDPFLCFSTP